MLEYDKLLHCRNSIKATITEWDTWEISMFENWRNWRKRVKWEVWACLVFGL